MPGLLALLAHPDDEFFCGGLLASISARSVPIHLVYWTRGEGGGSAGFRRFWGCFPAAWHPRTREAMKAAALLGATSLSFLGGIDPVPAPDLRAPVEEPAEVVGKLAKLCAQHAPEIIVTHGSDGDYGHPAHRKLHGIAREFAATAPAIGLLTFNAAGTGVAPCKFVNASDPADFVLNAGLYLEVKRNIVRAHDSQKGVLEFLSGTDGTMAALLEATRYEGYRCWGGREAMLAKLRTWTSPAPVGSEI